MTPPGTDEHMEGMGMLRELAELRAKAAPGKWAWRGYANGSIELRTVGHGGLRIITTHHDEPCIVGVDDGDPVLTEWACPECREMYRQWEATGDTPEGYRCPKPESLNTVWLNDPDRGFIRPSNDWAVKEVPYREDVARVDHPDAAYIAAAGSLSPEAWSALAGVVEAARDWAADDDRDCDCSLCSVLRTFDAAATTTHE